MAGWRDQFEVLKKEVITNAELEAPNAVDEFAAAAMPDWAEAL